MGSAQQHTNITSAQTGTILSGTSTGMQLLDTYLNYKAAKANTANIIKNLNAQAELQKESAIANINAVNTQAREQAEILAENYAKSTGTSRVTAAVSGMDITQGSAKEVYKSGYINYLKDQSTLSENVGNAVKSIETSSAYNVTTLGSQAAQATAIQSTQASALRNNLFGEALAGTAQILSSNK